LSAILFYFVSSSSCFEGDDFQGLNFKKG